MGPDVSGDGRVTLGCFEVASRLYALDVSRVREVVRRDQRHQITLRGDVRERSIDAVWEDGDFNGDELVDFADFVIMANNFGNSRQPVAAATSSMIDQFA